MIVKYRIEKYSRANIYRCTFDRETDNFLIRADGRRRAKRSEYEQYFDTWAEAHAALTARAADGIATCLRNLELAKEFSGNVEGMKEPT